MICGINTPNLPQKSHIGGIFSVENNRKYLVGAQQERKKVPQRKRELISLSGNEGVYLRSVLRTSL